MLPPWPTLALLLLAAGRPLPALVSAAVPVVRVHRVLRRTGLPTGPCALTAARLGLTAVTATLGGLGGSGTVTTAPLLVAALAGRRTRRAALVALVAPPLLEYLVRRPALDPLRWTGVRLVDDLAYASGVWRGCWTARTLAPLRPSRSRPR